MVQKQSRKKRIPLFKKVAVQLSSHLELSSPLDTQIQNSPGFLLLRVHSGFFNPVIFHFPHSLPALLSDVHPSALFTVINCTAKNEARGNFLHSLKMN